LRELAEIADLLERRGIPGVEERGLLKNDRQIVDWDRSRGPWHGPQYLDPARPRVEVELSPVQLSL